MGIGKGVTPEVQDLARADIAGPGHSQNQGIGCDDSMARPEAAP